MAAKIALAHVMHAFHLAQAAIVDIVTYSVHVHNAACHRCRSGCVLFVAAAQYLTKSIAHLPPVCPQLATLYIPGSHHGCPH